MSAQNIHVRYTHLDINERICPICNQEVETEEHVLTRCPAYMIFRNELYTASSDINDVFEFSDVSQSIHKDGF